MPIVDSLIQDFVRLVRGHLLEILLALAATVLSVFGGDINRAVKKAVRKQPFLVRLAVFVLLCAVGYGVLTVLLGKVLAYYLAQLSNVWLISTLAGLFVLIGLIAEERRQI